MSDRTNYALSSRKIWDLHFALEQEPRDMPDPADVPPGEVWVLTYRGCEAVGIRNSDAFTAYPWNIIHIPDGDVDPGFDAGVMLICRLTPEVIDGDSVCRLADRAKQMEQELKEVRAEVARLRATHPNVEGTRHGYDIRHTMRKDQE